MSVDLNRQLREYCRQMDEHQGSLSFQDILDRAEDVQVIPRAAESTRPTPRYSWIAAAAALLVLITLLGIRFLPAMDQNPGPADQPTTTIPPPRTDFPESGPVEAGTYHIEPSESSVTGVTLTMPDGWTTQDGLPTAIKESDQDGEVFFFFITVDTISSEPCLRRDGMAVGPSVDDLAQALLDLPHTSVTGPFDTTLGGLPAKRVDMTIADDFDTEGCSVPGLQIWYSEPADNHFVLLDDGTASVYIFDVDGERQVFVTHYRAGARAEDIAEMQTIVDSIAIDATTTMPAPEAAQGLLRDFGLPGMSPNEPARTYGWTGALGTSGWIHKVIDEDPSTSEGARETQILFAVKNDCFTGSQDAEPRAVTVAGLEGLHLEPYDDDSLRFVHSGATTAAYALPIADRTLCVYLRWNAATTPDELRAAREVVESIRGEPNGENGIRINFELPHGWDTG